MHFRVLVSISKGPKDNFRSSVSPKSKIKITHKMFTISLCESNELVSPVAATRTGFCLTRPILNEYSHTVRCTYIDVREGVV